MNEITTAPEFFPYGDKKKCQRSKLIRVHTKDSGTWGGYAYKFKMDVGSKVKGQIVFATNTNTFFEDEQVLGWSDWNEAEVTE